MIATRAPYRFELTGITDDLSNRLPSPDLAANRLDPTWPKQANGSTFLDKTSKRRHKRHKRPNDAATGLIILDLSAVTRRHRLDWIGLDWIVLWAMAFASLEVLYRPDELPSLQTSNDVPCGDSYREIPPTPERTGLLMLTSSYGAACNVSMGDLGPGT